MSILLDTIQQHPVLLFASLGMTVMLCIGMFNGDDYLGDEESLMPQYMATRPFRVWYSQSIGVTPGERGPRLMSDGYPTLEEARAGIKRLPAGHSLIRITEGPDTDWVEHPLKPE